MIIKNAHWLNPDGRFEEGDIVIKDGRITGLRSARTSPTGEQEIDATGMLVLPGAIDPHVHFREPGQLYKEGIDSGSRAALRGGVTTIVDMPNNNPPCTTARRIAQKKDRFRRKSHINWGVMLHTTPHNSEDLAGQITSAKVYMAKSSALPAITSLEAIKKIFNKYPVVSFHAEDETEFDTTAQRSPLHHENRPRASITTALGKIEQALKETDQDSRPRVIICHMNTAEEVEWVVRLKSADFDVWGETCPHYLYFTQDNYIKQGTAFQVNPPIRTAADQQRLRQGLADGGVDFMGTDHAPHTRDEKSSAKPPSGIAAIEWLVPQMLHFVDEGLIGWKRFNDLMCAGAATCYNIDGRDGIKKGNYADLVLVGQAAGNTESEAIQTKAGVNLYRDFNFKWRVKKVLVNGILKLEEHTIHPQIKGKEV